MSSIGNRVPIRSVRFHRSKSTVGDLRRLDSALRKRLIIPASAIKQGEAGRESWRTQKLADQGELSVIVGGQVLTDCLGSGATLVVTNFCEQVSGSDCLRMCFRLRLSPRVRGKMKSLYMTGARTLSKFARSSIESEFRRISKSTNETFVDTAVAFQIESLFQWKYRDSSKISVIHGLHSCLHFVVSCCSISSRGFLQHLGFPEPSSAESLFPRNILHASCFLYANPIHLGIFLLRLAPLSLFRFGHR